MIEIPIGVLIGLILYALIATGMILVIVAGASKDLMDARMNSAALRESLFEQAKDAVKQNKDMVEMQDRQLELLKKYVDIQNEYAWYRIWMRDGNRKLALEIEAKLQERKHEKVG